MFRPVIVSVLFFILLVSARSAWAVSQESRSFEAEERRLALQQMQEQDPESSSTKEEDEKQRVENERLKHCDDAYAECLDKAFQDREYCGNGNQSCIDAYKRDSRDCIAANDTCEKSIS